MLSSEKFYVKSDCFKVESGISMRDYVVSLIRNTELSRLLDKKSFKDGKKTIESEHADIDVMEVSEDVVNLCLKKDAGQWLKDRDEIKALKDECTNCLPIDKITSLSLTDRVNIILVAHSIYKNVVLDNDIFDIEKGGIDISKSVQTYYKKGSMKDLKDALRPVFNKLVGTEGDYFYAVKTKKSDFSDTDLRNFLASFGGTAKREKSKTKIDGKDVVTFKDYNYVDKSGNKKIQVSAFTTLCAVVLANASKHDVIRPKN